MNMSTARRLLFLNPDPRASAGSNISLLNILAGLSGANYSFHMAAPASAEYLEALQHLDVRLHPYQANNWWFPSPHQLYKHLGGLRERVQALTDIIRRHDIDLVYTNAEYAFEGALAAAFVGVPHVWAQRVRFSADIDVLRHFPLSPSALAGLMMKFSDRIVVNTRDLLTTFPAWVPQAKFEVIESGIAPPVYRLDRTAARKALRDQARIPENSFVVLAVSRVSPEKDLQTWLRAAVRVRAQYPQLPIHFVHVGAPTAAACLTDLLGKCQGLGLVGHVHFLGAKRLEEMPDIYQGADVFTLTSEAEGFARACAEAMLSGIPTVSTRCGGPLDYIEHGTSGLLCNVADDTAIAKHIVWFWEHPDQARAMGDQGRASIQRRYDHCDLNARWNRLFQSLLDTPRTGIPDLLNVELTVNLLNHLGQIGMQIDRQATRAPSRASRILMRLRDLFR